MFRIYTKFSNTTATKLNLKIVLKKSQNVNQNVLLQAVFRIGLT